MAVQHQHLAAVEEPCVYLDGLTAAMEHRVLSGVSPGEHERFLELGWRHFGSHYFRPVCAACRECVSIRVPVAGFRPSKSQRRALSKCAHLRVAMGPPIADAARIDLYQAWHAMREETRGWQPSTTTMEDYASSFCRPHACARELAYYDGDRLVAVGIVDVTSNAMSSTYFYYHPDCSARGIGVASVLIELALGRQLGISHLYLGYCVRGCPSTAYKARYAPHEVLIGRPEISERAVWKSPKD